MKTVCFFLLCMFHIHALSAQALNSNRKMNMDTTVSPAEDFYLFANGGWLAREKMPASKNSWGAVEELQEVINQRIKNILEDITSVPKKIPGSPEQIAGDFFTSAMDSAKVDALGSQPLLADIKIIQAINTKKDWVRQLAVYRSVGRSMLFSLSVDPDAKNTRRYLLHLGQGGLSLSDRDMYLTLSDRNIRILDSYKKYVSAVFEKLGLDTQYFTATAVMCIETALAKLQYDRVTLRKPEILYNKLAPADIDKNNGQLNWPSFLSQCGLANIDTVVINNPGFFSALTTVIDSFSIAQLKSYMAWNVIRGMVSYLSNDFVQLNFEMNKELYGQQKQAPRSTRMMQLLDATMGQLIGKIYVTRYFDLDAKKRILSMVNNIQEVLLNRINNNTWMSRPTKDAAILKLNSYVKKIGFPDKWENFSTLTIHKDSFVQNMREIYKWTYQKEIEKLNGPVDKSVWHNTPTTINAYYNASGNEIAFTAAILQPPYFDPQGDDAANYGAIGSVMAHEMTHGFDDKGRKFDKEGNLNNWWSESDIQQFEKRSAGIVAQYGSYTVLDTMHLNPGLTLGENISDVTGVSVAYEAYKKAAGKKEKNIEGLTNDQRFFIAWAQLWRSLKTEARIKQDLLTDKHSPPKYRCIGPLVNMPAFYKAFGIKQGDKMFLPENKQSILY
jgi:putative endopeptidase